MRLSFDRQRKLTKLGLSEHGNLAIHTVRHFFCTYYLVNGGQLHNLSVAEEHSRVSSVEKNLGSGVAKKTTKVC